MQAYNLHVALSPAPPCFSFNPLGVFLLCHWAWHTFHLASPHFYFPPAGLSFAALVMHSVRTHKPTHTSSLSFLKLLAQFSPATRAQDSCWGDISPNMSGCYFYPPSFKSAISEESSEQQWKAEKVEKSGAAVSCVCLCPHFTAYLRAHCKYGM